MWRRFIPLAVGAALLGVGKIAFSGHLLINFTPSIPRGLYWISHEVRPVRGDLVVFPIPDSVRDLLYERQYVPRTIRLLAKPVSAIGGDHVCVRDHQVVVNGHVAGNVLAVDRDGKPMPQYSGCGVLPPGELFVSTEHANSFDSRYFGPLDLRVVRGTLSALLTF
ncbi:MAG TPA: conjugative transfer signal peptidase TraF [Polyangiaceae bacterium]|nr:conjugative transfer signal peptidase TraF [Polyangiaceae bacterium]